MTDISSKLAFFEKRLTIFERELCALKTSMGNDKNAKMPERLIKIDCNAPGLIASEAYRVEKNKDQRAFCWIGSESTIQIRLPVAPIISSTCKVFMMPHGKVDMGNLKLFVNDALTDYNLVRCDDYEYIVFNVPESPRPHIEINFQGLTSVRPLDLGESGDDRLIAFRFYGAELEYNFDENSAGLTA